jgi:hypothetical protein
MRSHFKLLVALFLGVAGACAEVPGDVASGGSAALVRPEATLVFTADFAQRVEGELVAGGVAFLDYDVARLTGCRGERHGRPAWAITAHYRIAGGEVRSVHVAGHAAALDQVGLPLELDRAGQLEVWFENNSSFGCQAWDSALGANYRFTVGAAPGSAAEVRFAADWSTTLEGTPIQGGRLDIVYDVTRLPTCRDTRYGQPAWSILARYRLPSGRTGYVPVTSGTGTLELTEAGEIELWFENQGYGGCRAHDSRFGQNYRIVVDPDPRAPGWLGNAAYVIERRTCDAGPCEDTRRPLELAPFSYDSWARQRAAIRAIYFDVWKAGVTDRDNPELWRELDVKVHHRARFDGAFTSRPVAFFRRAGNDARYELPMAELDPLAAPYRIDDPASCPDADLLTSGDGVTVGANVEFYFTVNGVVLKRHDGANFYGRFENYRDAFEVCISE